VFVSFLPTFLRAISKNSVKVPFSITADPFEYASPKNKSGYNKSL